MTDSNDDQSTDYQSYARFCLKLASQMPDRNSRLVLREMAAQWLQLSDAGDRAPQRHDGFDGHGTRSDAAS